MAMTYIPQIPLEDLVYVEFKDHENLQNNPAYLKQITKDLNRAGKDGNVNKTKHIIIFQSTSGVLRVKGTLWMVGKEYVLLKQNVHIPIASIIKVQ